MESEVHSGCSERKDHRVDHMNGVEPENSGDVIHMDDDSAFSAYRDNAEDSDSSDVEG